MKGEDDMVVERPGLFFAAILVALATTALYSLWTELWGPDVVSYFAGRIDNCTPVVRDNLADPPGTTFPSVPGPSVRVFLFVLVVPFLWDWSSTESGHSLFRCFLGASVLALIIASFTDGMLSFKPLYLFYALLAFPLVMIRRWFWMLPIALFVGILSYFILSWTSMPLFDGSWHEIYQVNPKAGDWFLWLMAFGREALGGFLIILGSSLAYFMIRGRCIKKIALSVGEDEGKA